MATPVADAGPFGAGTIEDDPWEAYAAFRRDRAVVWSPTHRSHLVFGYDDVRKALTNPEFVTANPFRASRRAFGPTVLDLDGPSHRRLRAVFTNAFRPSVVESHAVATVGEFVDRWLAGRRPGEVVDVVADLAQKTPMRVLCSLLGFPPDDAPLLDRIVNPLVRYIDHAQVPFDEIRASRADAQAYLTERLFEGPGPHGPAGDAFLDALASGELTEREAMSNAVLLLIGATATTVCGIANVVDLLFRDPSAIAGIRAGEVAPLTAVDEALRLEPSVRFTPRFVGSDTELGSATMRRGDALLLCIASANRDGEVYESPDEYRPSRTGPPPVTFGRGVHSCIGAYLARTESAAVVASLASRADTFELVGERPAKARGWTFRVPASLPLRFVGEC